MNRVYFFTGTGNSLHIAEAIAEALSDCEVIAIRTGTDPRLPVGYERIGFVFPTYGWGLPNMVADFLKHLDWAEQGGTYLFAVTTCFGFDGNAVPQARALLREHGCRLDYGTKIRMAGNAVTNYEMTKNINKVTLKSDQRAIPVIHDIITRQTKRIPEVNRSLFKMYEKYMADIPETDRQFTVNEDCISCGICRRVCPADNIILADGRPVFRHQCERCLACLQHCPQRAINYADKTQSRGRYTHPAAGDRKIAGYYDTSCTGK